MTAWGFTRERERERERESRVARRRGIPIGNLTSQIFANIYLDEFDQFVLCSLRPREYLRYGDDFIIIDGSWRELRDKKNAAEKFARESLHLEINRKNDIIIHAKQGLKFLGVEIFPKGRRLKKRNWRRVEDRLNVENAASYKGLVDKHSKEKKRKYYNWIILDKISE